MVTDNASNMKSAATSAKFNHHVGCFAHTLNIAAQKAVKITPLSKPLAKIRQVVGYFHRSTTAYAIMKEKQALLILPEHKLIIDVVTRWNSTYDMVQRYLEQQPALQAALLSKDLRVRRESDINPLSDNNINAAEDLVTVLKTFKTATVVMCDETKPTISVVWALHSQIVQSLQETDSDSIVTKQMKLVMLNDLSGRYKENQDFSQRAAALDPRFKSLPHLQTDVERMKVFTELAIEASQTKVKVKQEPKDDEPSTSTTVPALPALPLNPNTESEADCEVQCTSPKRVKLSQSDSDSDTSTTTKCALDELFGDVFVCKVEPAVRSPLDIASDEVNRYQKEAGLNMNQNPLTWWKNNSLYYPLLSRFARKCLSVPGTSVPSERIFSTAGDIVTATRSTLKPKHVDTLIFLKKNLK